MWRMIWTFVLLLVAAAAHAQSETCCAPGETYKDCFEAAYQAEAERSRLALKPSADALEASAVANLKQKPTSAASPGAAGSLRDTLAAFLGDLGLGTINDEADDLTFVFNPEIFRISESVKLALSAVLRDPEPYDVLLAELAEDVREARKASFDEDLADFDDVEVRLAGSLENGYFGRVYRPHQGVLSAMFFEILDASAPEVQAEEDDRDLAWLETQQKLEPLMKADPALRIELEQDSPKTVQERSKALQPADAATLSALDTEVQTRLCAAAASWAKAQAERVEAIRASDIIRIADLVNNQPQLSFDGFYRSRARVAGPDSYGGELTFEWSPASMNDLESTCPGPVDLTCFQSYLARGGKGFQLERAPRLSFSLKASRIDDYRFSSQDDGIDLRRDATDELVARLSGGLYVHSNDVGQQLARLELQGEYCDVDDDPDRQDRGVVTLTYTQNVSASTAAAVSLVWATKPEFRGDVDEELSANVGLKLGFDRKLE